MLNLSLSATGESTESRAWRARVLSVLAHSLARCAYLHACLLACLRGLRFYLLACLMCLFVLLAFISIVKFQNPKILLLKNLYVLLHWTYFFSHFVINLNSYILKPVWRKQGSQYNGIILQYSKAILIFSQFIFSYDFIWFLK